MYAWRSDDDIPSKAEWLTWLAGLCDRQRPGPWMPRAILASVAGALVGGIQQVRANGLALSTTSLQGWDPEQKQGKHHGPRIQRGRRQQIRQHRPTPPPTLPASLAPGRRARADRRSDRGDDHRGARLTESSPKSLSPVPMHNAPGDAAGRCPGCRSAPVGSTAPGQRAGTTKGTGTWTGGRSEAVAAAKSKNTRRFCMVESRYRCKLIGEQRQIGLNGTLRSLARPAGATSQSAVRRVGQQLPGPCQ